MRSLRRLRIFVVNGDPDMNAVWREIFARFSELFEIDGGGSFRTVEEAVAALSRIDPAPDLVLTNLRFSPEDDQALIPYHYNCAVRKGIEFIGRARDICPVIVVSGASDSLLAKAREAGAFWVGHPPRIVTYIAEMVFCQYRALCEVVA